MNAIRYVALAILVSAVVLGWPASSRAYLSMPKEPIAHKVAAADCVVLGKITAIRAKPQQGQVWRYSAKPQWDFTIVEVEVAETLTGPRGVKQARFGFRNIKHYKPAIEVGQIGFFCGVKVGTNDFYIVPTDCFCEQNDPSFKKDLALARRLGGLLWNPDEGLKSKDADDRLLTAYLLLLRACYVPWRHGETGKTEPIDRAQSKRILLALAEGNWNTHGQEVRDAVAALQLAVKFGAPIMKSFPSQQGEDQWPADAKEWLKQNAATYRIHRVFRE